MGSGPDTAGSPRRKRDADATRAALLAAARDLFGRHGYEKVTLRDIGEQAGVDASLIARYFGNKAAVHRSAVAEDSRDVDVPAEIRDLGSYTAYALHRTDRRGAPGPLVQALLSQSSAPEVRASAAEELQTRLVAPLAERLTAEGHENPAGRAEVLVSCLVGLIALRSTDLFGQLSAMSPEDIGAVLESAAQLSAGTQQPVAGPSGGPESAGATDALRSPEPQDSPGPD